MKFVFVPAGVFFCLSAVHIYWATGGHRGIASAIPSRRDGSPLFTPGPVACTAVALCLLAVAYLCLAYSQVIPAFLSISVLRGALLIVGAVFFFRAVGDFRYVGLFRGVRDTRFARMDRVLFTPLCLGLSVSLIFLALKQVS